MIHFPSMFSLSTGTGAVFIGPDATCTRSLRPSVGVGLYRVVRFVGEVGVGLGQPIPLCLPIAAPSLSAHHFEICRADYQAEGGEPIGGDATLARTLSQPSITTTAQAPGRRISTGTTT